MLRKRFFSTQTPPSSFTLNPKPQTTNVRRPNWAITQVTKSNFTNSVTKLKNLISDSDYIAVSLQKTGTYSSPWHRILPFDTAETAYLKAKYAAEKFQIFQLAVCPFSVRGSTNKIIAHPLVSNTFYIFLLLFMCLCLVICYVFIEMLLLDCTLL